MISSARPLTGDDRLSSPEGYQAWSTQMYALLHMNGAWFVVESQPNPPATDKTDPTNHLTIETWADANSIAQSLIVLSVDPTKLYLIGRTDRASVMWTKLRKHFQPTDDSGVTGALTRLFSMHYDATASIDDFIKEYRGILSELSAAKKEMPEWIVSVHLLHCLPSSFDTLRTSLRVNGDLPGTEAMITTIRQEASQNADNNHAALIAASAAAQLPPSPCPACGNSRHWLRECTDTTKLQTYRARQASKKQKKKEKKPATAPAAAVATLPTLESVIDQETSNDFSIQGWLATPDSAADISAYSPFGPKTDSNPVLATFGVSATSIQAYTVSSTTSPFTKGAWYIDTGASQHITGDIDLLRDITYVQPVSLAGVGSTSATITAVGTAIVPFLDSNYVLTNVIYSKDANANLISVPQLTKAGLVSYFGAVAKIVDPKAKNQVIAEGYLTANNLYRLGSHKSEAPCEYTKVVAALGIPLTVWHMRFGHLNTQALRALASKDLVNGLAIHDISAPAPPACSSCLAAKSHRHPFPESDSRARKILELVHSDVLSIPTPSLGGARYLVTFVDDYSRKLWVYPMQSKAETFDRFVDFHRLVERSASSVLLTLRSDNGGEYISHKFRDYLRAHGISHQFTAPYTPEQNGVAERINLTLVESIRAMLHHSGLPHSLWAEAAMTFCYVKNRSPHRALDGNIPDTLFFGRKPLVSHLRVFGCTAYTHVPKERRTKLDDTAKPFIFTGYDVDAKAYRVYDPATQRISISRDVRFIEDQFPARSASSPQTRIPISLIRTLATSFPQSSQHPASGIQHSASIESAHVQSNELSSSVTSSSDQPQTADSDSSSSSHELPPSDTSRFVPGPLP